MAYIDRFISRRYIFGAGRKALMTAITLIAVSGVAVGVAALIIVIGVMDGAEKELFGKVIGIFPHVRVARAMDGSMTDAHAVLAKLQDRPHVAAAEPVIAKQALMSARVGKITELTAAQIYALSDTGLHRLYDLKQSMRRGSLELGVNDIVLGAPLAETMEADVGDSILVVTAMTAPSANRQRPSARLRVAGIFDTGYYSFDSLAAFVSADTASALFGVSVPDYIHVQLDDPFVAEALGRELRLELGPAYEVRTWVDENGFFFQSLTLQKIGLFLILMLIVLVAGFNIVGTLILMVIDKTREIGIMKAFGSPDRLVRGAFFKVGFLIGLIGTLLGVALGLFGVYLLENVITLEMPPSVYNFERLPVLVKPMTVAVIVFSSMAVCMLAALFPAAQAARLDPVESLRHE